jgi:TolB protein
MRRSISNFKFPISNWVVAALCLGLTTSAAFAAKEVPTITVSKSDQINLAVTPLGGGEGATATKVLQNDLALSGYFKIGGGNSSFTVSGTASGGSLQGQVVDHGGSTVLSKSYPPQAGARATTPISLPTTSSKPSPARRAFAGSRIAFIATRSGRKEVYVADCDGSNVRQMTHDNTISVHPSLSSDGGRIAYTGYQSGYADVYVIDLGSGRRNRIVNFPGTNSGAAFSPNGDRIALTISKDGNPELYVVSANGGGARRLTHTRGIESSPTGHRTGVKSSIPSIAGRSTALSDFLERRRGQRLSAGYGYCTEPSWSPDGKKLAFNVRSGGEFQVAVLDLGGGGAKIVGTGEDPAWGADSRHLIFAEGGALYMLDTISSRKNKFLDGLGKITEPSWSR